MEKCSSTSILHKKVIHRGSVSLRLSVKTAAASQATSRLVVNVFRSAHTSKCMPLDNNQNDLPSQLGVRRNRCTLVNSSGYCNVW